MSGFIFGYYAFAQVNNTIYCEEFNIKRNNYVSIPVKIKNNTGLMGFKFNISINDDVVVKLVKSGDVTAVGNFNYNIKDSKEIIVLWNNTENIKQDGILFYIDLIIPQQATEQSIIIDYSKDDTFDENYNNVELHCNKIVISDSTVRNVLKDNTVADDSIPKTNNDLIEFEEKYKSSKIINSIIDECLKNEKVDNIDNIKNKNRFIKNFINIAKNKKIDVPTNIKEDEYIEVIKKMYSKNDGKVNLIYFVAAVFVLLLCSAFIVYKIKKR